MKIVVIGATGTIGSAVAEALEGHEVVRVGHSHGDRRLDMESADAIQALFSSPGTFDALVCAAGNAAFQPLADLEEGHSQLSVRSNVVSPPWVAETLQAMGRDPGEGLPAAVVARSYVDNGEGRQTGQVIQAG